MAEYNADLMSYLAVNERRLPFTTLDEAVTDPSVEFYVEKSTVGETFIRVSGKYIKRIGGLILMDHASNYVLYKCTNNLFLKKMKYVETFKTGDNSGNIYLHKST